MRVELHRALVFGIMLAIEGGQAQTKIMEYKTELTFEDWQVPPENNPTFEGYWPLGEVTQIGAEFIAVAVTREAGDMDTSDEILYIFDIKKNKLAMKLDDAETGFYWIIPSGTTHSFFLRKINRGGMRYDNVEFYNYIKKQRGWVLGETKLAGVIERGDRPFGYSWIPSIPLAPGYFVKTIRGSDGKLEIHIFQF